LDIKPKLGSSSSFPLPHLEEKNHDLGENKNQNIPLKNSQDGEKDLSPQATESDELTPKIFIRPKKSIPDEEVHSF
jgi:hypothetical protein